MNAAQTIAYCARLNYQLERITHPRWRWQLTSLQCTDYPEPPKKMMNLQQVWATLRTYVRDATAWHIVSRHAASAYVLATHPRQLLYRQWMSGCRGGAVDKLNAELWAEQRQVVKALAERARGGLPRHWQAKCMTYPGHLSLVYGFGRQMLASMLVDMDRAGLESSLPSVETPGQRRYL
jgi:hypothetical protein